MKDKNVFEKARMDSILIPMAGFIAACALILAAIFIIAYCGGFTRLSDRESEQSAEFDAPETPAYDYGIETVNENPECDVSLNIIEFTSSDDGAVSYKFDLLNKSDCPAHIKDVRCMMYRNDKCVKSSSLAGGISLAPHDFDTISGSAQTDGADTLIFYVSWKDKNNASADTYTVCRKK